VAGSVTVKARPATERPTADGHAPLTQPGPRLVANRGLAWLIGALRLFGGSWMHRISLITRIHHVIRADLMPLRCMIPWVADDAALTVLP
jgi:hypothetical protein